MICSRGDAPALSELAEGLSGTSAGAACGTGGAIRGAGVVSGLASVFRGTGCIVIGTVCMLCCGYSGVGHGSCDGRCSGCVSGRCRGGASGGCCGVGGICRGCFAACSHHGSAHEKNERKNTEFLHFLPPVFLRFRCSISRGI